MNSLSPVITDRIVCVLDNIKVQYLQFMSYMKTPQYRTSLQQALEQEKVKHGLHRFQFILMITRS